MGMVNDKVSQAALARGTKKRERPVTAKDREEACLTGDVVTAPGSQKLIHGLEVEMPEDILRKRNGSKKLHIEQMRSCCITVYEKKGDQISGLAEKVTRVMPKLIIPEDIEEESREAKDTTDGESTTSESVYEEPKSK